MVVKTMMETGRDSHIMAWVEGIPNSPSNLHNSDLRDSHEYIQRQVWDERIITRQSSGREDC